MKKIFFLVILVTIFSCGKTNSQTAIYQEIAKSNRIALPYGEKKLLQDFPQDWNKGDIKYDALYNDLSAFLYQDAENATRNVIQSNYAEANYFLDKNFEVPKKVKTNKEMLDFKTAEIVSSSTYKVYSLFYEGKKDCDNCEFPENQAENMLVSMAKGKIVDKLLVSYEIGNDLEKSSRYFYVDFAAIIHIKDFKSDEEGTSFIQYLKYKIEKGKFIKMSE